MRFETFEDMLRHWAEDSPAETALLYAEGEARRRCSRGELLRQVREQAEALRESGKNCAAVLCDRTPECVVQVFGAVLAGLRVVMLNRSAPDGLLREQLKDTEADLLLGAEERHEALAPALAERGSGGAGELLFFTSGTMERSRAVVLTQRNLCASAWNGSSLLPLGESDRLLSDLPPDHVFGFVCGLLWGLNCGAAVALGRGIARFAEDSALFAPTALAAVPAMVSELVKKRLLNPELHTLLIGAADCRWELVKTVSAMGIRVSCGYGLTEAASGVALSLGEDPRAMTLCPEVSVEIAPDGEILVTAPSCMFRGYWKDPEATAAALQDGVLHTGDLGELDENGLLHITGRKKEILVLPDGAKLWLPEYERDLARALETRDLAVVLAEGAPALVLPEDGPDRESVLRAVNALSAIQPWVRRPEKLLYLPGALPRTSTGKLRRWELQETVEQN